jgi:hypothetical protein
MYLIESGKDNSYCLSSLVHRLDTLKELCYLASLIIISSIVSLNAAIVIYKLSSIICGCS